MTCECGKEKDPRFARCSACNSLGVCRRCHANVEAPNYLCPTGEAHDMPVQVYYKDDAPADGGYTNGPGGSLLPSGKNLSDSRTVVCGLVPEKTVMRGHETITIPGKNVTFVRGLYSTSNPEEQYFLDQHVERGKCCTEARWTEVYFTHEQKLELQRNEMQRRIDRIEKERNSLLEQVKRQKVPA